MNKNSNILGMGKQMPPIREHVLIYFEQKGMSVKDGHSFYEFMEKMEWKSEFGTPVKNWKTIACDWIWQICSS